MESFSLSRNAKGLTRVSSDDDIDFAMIVASIDLGNVFEIRDIWIVIREYRCRIGVIFAKCDRLHIKVLPYARRGLDAAK